MSSESSVTFGGSPKSKDVVRYDARGVLLPDYTFANWECIPPESFWNAGQYYVTIWHTQDLHHQLLDRIPNRCFRKIQCLCLDFGWKDTSGFVNGGSRRWKEYASTAGPKRPYMFGREEKELIDSILERGDDKVIIKLLWSTTLYSPLEGRSHEENKEYHGTGVLSAEFRNFRKAFAEWGYGDRVRIITRVSWLDELPNEDFPEVMESARYHETEDLIWEIDPVSEKFIWRSGWASVRISYGLVWDPLDR